MRNNIVIVLLITGQLTEILYIVFRNPKLNRYNYIIYSVCVVISASLVTGSFTPLNFIKLISILMVLSSKVYFRNKPYEKPDYRYLLILAGTIIINFI